MKSTHRSCWIFVSGCLLFAVVFYRIFFHAHAMDWRAAYFNVMDSFYMYRVLLEKLGGRSLLSPQVYDVGYGTPYYLLAYAVMKIREMLGYGTDLLDIDTAVRILSFVPAMALIPMYRWMQSRLQLPKMFWLFSCMVTFSAYEFFFYCVFPKPDVLQYLLLLPACYFLIQIREKKNVASIIWATVFCALAASVKLAGVFLFPWVCIMTLVNGLADGKLLRNRMAVVHWALRVVLPMTLLFLVIYLVLNPRWLINFKENWNYVLVTQDKGWAGNSVWQWNWFKVAGELGYFLWVSYFGFLFVRCRNLLREFAWTKISGEDLLALFPLAFFSYLFLDVLRFYPLRYLFPVLPMLLIATARFWQAMWVHWVPQNASQKKKVLVGLSICGLFVIGDLNRFVPGVRQIRSIAQYESSDRALMGKYLLENYPKEAKIAFYFYCWVPTAFHQAKYFFSYDPQIIELLTPDLVLLTGHARNQEFLKAVEEKSEPFRLAKRIGDYLLFERVS